MFKNTGWRNSILEDAIFLPYSSSDSILELTLEKRVSLLTLLTYESTLESPF